LTIYYLLLDYLVIYTMRSPNSQIKQIVNQS